MNDETFKTYRLKVDNLKDLNYYGYFTTGGSILQKWLKSKPNNEELKTLSAAWVEVHFMVRKLKEECQINEEAFVGYRNDKLRAIERARKSEQQVQDLEEKIKDLENQLKTIKQIHKL